MAARRIPRFLATVRARTTLAATLVVAAALALGAVALVIVLRQNLTDHVDEAVRRRAQDVATLTVQGNLPTTIAATGRETAIVQIVDAGGKVVASTLNLRGKGPIVDSRPSTDRPRVRTVTGLPIPDERDDDFRVAALRTQTEDGLVYIYAAESLERVYESVGAVRSGLLVGLPPLVALVGLTSWFIVGRALRPVEAIREQVADISAHELSARVPEPATDDEIGRLARTMNDMLERLEAFTERQRRFVSDASHELQSPLATSLADLEVALADPTRANWPETAAGVAADAERMTRLVRDLLFLARADDPAAAVPSGLLDLDDVVQEEVARLRMRSPVAVHTRDVAPAEVRGSADQLGRVVRNLLENAVRYARSGVEVELGRSDNSVVLTVADDGPGVAEPDRERIFERFTRLDDSRSRSTGGTGLGLAIAREIVERHGGTIAVDSNGSGARFVVRLPHP